MESREQPLKKELEEELKLSTDDLRSHAWYHGPLPRQEAESLVQNEGEFLIRDSRSSSGDYVLTCRCRREAMHFKIIRVVLRPRKGYSRTLFQFEQDQFDNIPALVRFYVGNGNPVSESSGAVILHPVTRLIPLRLLAERYGASGQPSAEGWSTLRISREPSQRRSLRLLSAVDIGESNLLRTKDKCGSQPANLDTVGRSPTLYTAQSDSNLLTGNSEAPLSPADRGPPPPSPIFRTGSDPVLRANSHQNRPDSAGGVALRGSDGQLHSKAPPKPLRAPSLLLTEPLEDLGPDSTYCELVPRAPTSSRSHVDRLLVEEKWKMRARATETTFGFLDSEVVVLPPLSPCAEEEMPQAEGEEFVRPVIQQTSSFQPKSFSSLLLAPDNKPLDPGALKRLKGIFLQSDCRVTAMHILQIDCQVARIRGVSREQQRMMGVSSGLELITLPHGSQLRKDLLERHHLIALGIAVDILGCTGALAERVSTLNRIIQLASELKVTAGDLFAFSAVMKALEFPQIVRLEQTWQALRQTHTDTAITFEKQLKPFMKALNEGKENTPVEGCGVTIPHILPLVKLMEGAEVWEHTEESCELLLRVLESARSNAMNVRLYQDNAEAKLRDFHPCPELLEAFNTEFALRLFWGSKGAEVAQAERYKKFNQILSVLSQKLEPER